MRKTGSAEINTTTTQWGSGTAPIPTCQTLAASRIRDAYFDGYVAGTEMRDERMTGGNGHVIIPEWMTRNRSRPLTASQAHPHGSRDWYEFFTRVHEAGIGSDRYAGINWCGMFVGIEPDGYSTGKQVFTKQEETRLMQSGGINNRWFSFTMRRDASFWIAVIRTMHTRGIDRNDDDAVREVVREIEKRRPTP